MTTLHDVVPFGLITHGSCTHGPHHRIRTCTVLGLSQLPLLVGLDAGKKRRARVEGAFQGISLVLLDWVCV